MQSCNKKLKTIKVITSRIVCPSLPLQRTYAFMHTPDSTVMRAKSTDCEAMISLHVFVTDFVAMISSQSEGLGKMALGIVKIYQGSPFPANRRCSLSVGSHQFVVDPCDAAHKMQCNMTPVDR